MAGRQGAHPADIEAIYRDRFRAFVTGATAYLGDSDDALDVVQEGFARALRRRRSFRGEGSLEGWIWHIVLNLARDRRRVESRDHVRVRSESSLDDPDLPDETVRARLLALPERQRLTIFLRYYAGLSYEEIAVVLGVKPGTVAASLSAAHSRLREQLQEVAT